MGQWYFILNELEGYVLTYSISIGQRRREHSR